MHDKQSNLHIYQKQTPLQNLEPVTWICLPLFGLDTYMAVTVMQVPADEPMRQK